MRFTRYAFLAAASLLLLGSAASANLIYNGGFEDFDYDTTNQTTTGFDVTWPLTVHPANTDWQTVTGNWVRVQAGDWEGAPGGTGNESTRCWRLRKGYLHMQAIDAAALAVGDELELNWDYFVDPSLTADVSFVLKVAGVKIAGSGEAATTVSNAMVFGGEAANAAVLATSEVLVVGGTAQESWLSAAATLLTLDQQWDYLLVSFDRVAGVTNNIGQQLDNISLTVVPEPASLSLLALGAFGLIRRRR